VTKHVSSSHLPFIMNRLLRRAAAILVVLAVITPRSALSQERGAIALDQLVRGLPVTARVLMIGAHPDDEDTQLIAFLARGRRVETAYLSLTRGDGGQNLIGNELGESLGAIRTEELLAARRVDGGRQYFSRAFDFGFSKTAEETFRHWNRDSLLGDVVTVIRSFRPQVIVSVFSGTPADGHGHHQVAGILAREAYDVAGDTVRFPTAKYGRPWAPMKFYRSARGNRVAGSVAMNAGEFDPVLGRSYGEIAGESRSQHRSQGFFGAQQRKGAFMDYVMRQGSRVNESTAPADEKSMFDGVDTTFARLAREAPSAARASLLQVQPLIDSARASLDLRRPDLLVRWLARAAELTQTAREATPRCFAVRPAGQCTAAEADVDASLDILRRRTSDAVLTAAGIAVEATAPQELLAFGDSIPVSITVYNRGRVPVALVRWGINGAEMEVVAGSIKTTAAGNVSSILIAPDSSARVEEKVTGLAYARPWWLGGRIGDMFAARQSPADGLARVSTADVPTAPGVAVAEDDRRTSGVSIVLSVAGATVNANVGPITFRTGDPVFGEQNRPAGGVPAVTLEFDRGLEWIPANKPIDRLLRLTLHSFTARSTTLSFKLLAPPGLRVDSIPTSLTLEPREQRELFVRVRGTLKPGRFEFGITGIGELGSYAEGFTEINYPHIRPIRAYRSSVIYLQSVEITVPTTLSVAYIQGVGDDVAPYLRQLGIPVTMITPAELPVTDLSRFSTVVVGTRAYQAHRELAVYNARLLDFAKRGGTLVVQYGQNEMMTPGILPYPIQLARTAARVTIEEAPVTLLDPHARILNTPNRIGDADWADWVQERAIYMPSTIDPHFATPLEMHDPDEPGNKGAILTTPLGKGMYVYTTLALFRQIPGGVPGGPRLFVNLLSAGQPPRPVAPLP
jgi:LmbE family N-acetylglucosaminyl deacetylase